MKWQGFEEGPPLGKSYTPLQVATRLGVGRQKVMTWIASGQLRAVNVASTVAVGKRARWRIDEQDLLTFEGARASCGTASTALTIPAAGAKASPSLIAHDCAVTDRRCAPTCSALGPAAAAPPAPHQQAHVAHTRDWRRWERRQRCQWQQRLGS